MKSYCVCYTELLHTGIEPVTRIGAGIIKSYQIFNVGTMILTLANYLSIRQILPLVRVSFTFERIEM